VAGTDAPRALVFDVNETLLDLGALDPWFEDTLGAGTRREWFALAIQAVLVTTVTRRYENFADIGAACFASVAARRNRPAGPEALEHLRAAMASLPPHFDVPPALTALREHGYRLAALTNNPLATVQAQLGAAGLTPLFDVVVSADEVRRLKPAPEPYEHAAARLGVDIGETMLVAAHGWDCAGARAAGAHAAFVARPGQAELPAGLPPDLVVPGMAELAAALI
jgi:2-haloacid dehalogenase